MHIETNGNLINKPRRTKIIVRRALIFIEKISEMCYNIIMTEKEARQLSPLVMAFVGDSVFTLYVRSRLASESRSKAGTLHKRASRFVSAAFQAYVMDEIETELTGDEEGVARRARNAHNNTVAKNATIFDYKRATAFEAVLGYLSLSGQNERLNYILEKAYLLDERKESGQ